VSYFTTYFTTYFREVAQSVAGGGWGAFNRVDHARRKRRELEEEADRLEVVLAEQGLVEPAPIVLARHTVREYAPQREIFSRRTQRAIDYAERVRTTLAYELAAKQIAQQIEDEEVSLLMSIALIA
jgi:hypothetical protein